MPTFLLSVTAWLILNLVQGMFYDPQYALSSEVMHKQQIMLDSTLINSGRTLDTSICCFIFIYIIYGFAMS